jgi:hypothetical protein
MDREDIRAITDDEVSHFRDYGWTKMDGLLSPGLAGRLLQRAKAHMGPNGDASVPRPDIDTPSPGREDRHYISEEEECFASVAHSPQMGANVQRLLRREVGVLLSADMLGVKIGTKQGSLSMCVEETPWHQDAPDQPIDRNGYIGIWIALDRVTPEMGGIRFVDKSHYLGLLGCTQIDLYSLYPDLHEMHVTEHLDFHPGDATAHAMYTVHGTGVNTTASPRWAFILSYIPEDARYTGGLPWSMSTMNRRARQTLAPGDQFGGRVLEKVYG